jgi:hypothetical protein
METVEYVLAHLRPAGPPYAKEQRKNSLVLVRRVDRACTDLRKNDIKTSAILKNLRNLIKSMLQYFFL